ISAQSSTASIPSVLPGSDTARVTDQVVRFELPRGGHFSRAADRRAVATKAKISPHREPNISAAGSNRTHDYLGCYLYSYHIRGGLVRAARTSRTKSSARNTNFSWFIRLQVFLAKDSGFVTEWHTPNEALTGCSSRSDRGRINCPNIVVGPE
ncbi:hypothetical protein, partial [Nocardia nova]|uniref:hypothetical protein n=1 Tax=Nocardia nova TaxID=37330 RepID=UPI001CA5956E